MTIPIEFKDQLFLTRKDLNKASKDKPFEDIDMDDFKISTRCFAACSYADFTDDDGQNKVLKSRSAIPIQGKIVRLQKSANHKPRSDVRMMTSSEISARDLLELLNHQP
jgi:hypothetical protein